LKDPFNATALKSPTLLIGYLKPFLLMTTDILYKTHRYRLVKEYKHK